LVFDFGAADWIPPARPAELIFFWFLLSLLCWISPAFFARYQQQQIPSWSLLHHTNMCHAWQGWGPHAAAHQTATPGIAGVSSSLSLASGIGDVVKLRGNKREPLEKLGKE
jgi:hypothetical protein